MRQPQVNRRRLVVVIVLLTLVVPSAALVHGATAASTEHRGTRSTTTPLMDQIAAARAARGASGPSAQANDCIQPPANTLGWTCSGPAVGTWQWDYQGPFDVQVDMGNLANMDKVSGNKGYQLDLALGAVAWYWYDSNGVYNPITDPACSNGGQFLCDDPALNEPFDIFKIQVNGQDLLTQQGWHEQILAENERSFELKPIGDDPAGSYHVPASMVHAGLNTITFVPLDSYTEYDAVMPYHSQANDGWEINIAALRMQLVAPPLFISHGWGFEWDPTIAQAGWQPALAQALRNYALTNLAQDPWQWATDLKGDPNGGIFLNAYDNKQDWRQSALLLGSRVDAYKQQLGYSGKVWLLGHSMGGIVSRSYTEQFGGSANVEKIATLDTPHTGSPFADFYTHFFWNMYKANDGALTAKYLGIDLHNPPVNVPIPGFGPFPVRPMPGATFLYWRDWWNPSVGANAWQFFGIGRDHLADFGIKPSGVSQTFKDPVTGLFTIHTMPSNPLLDQLNARYPAPGVDYFATVGLTTSLKDAGLAVLLQTVGGVGYFVGDAIVPADSEDLNGAIPSRPVSATHLDIMDKPDAQAYVFRFFTGLDVDSGADNNAPLSAPATGGVRETSPLQTTDGDVVVVQKTDLVNGAWEKPVTIDATVAQANFTVWTRLDMPALNVTLVDPSGVEHTKDVGVADRSLMYGESASDLVPLKMRTYYVAAPQPGTWTLRVQPESDIPDDGLPLYATAFIDSPIQLVAGTDADRYRAGDTATLRATVLDGGVARAGASVVATYVDDAGNAHSVPLMDDGQHGDLAANDGYYAATMPLPSADGALEVKVTASDGYVREKTVPLFVASEPDLSVSASDITTSPAKPWAGDAVNVTVTIRNVGERAAGGAALVLEDNGAPIATKSTNESIPVGGSATFAFSFASPAHVSTLTAHVAPLDLDLSAANDDASVALGNVPVGRTTATVTGPRGEGDWYTGPVTVKLAPLVGDASGESILASVDGAPAVAYAAPIALTTDGRHTVSYHAAASTGDVEPTRTLELGIDTVAPTASLASPAAGTVNVATVSAADPLGWTLVGGLVQLDVRAADATSGLARLDVLVDGQLLDSTTNASASGYQFLWDSTVASMGNHLLTVRVHDAAGHTAEDARRVYVLASRTATIERDPNATQARLDPRRQ